MFIPGRQEVLQQIYVEGVTNDCSTLNQQLFFWTQLIQLADCYFWREKKKSTMNKLSTNGEYIMLIISSFKKLKGLAFCSPLLHSAKPLTICPCPICPQYIVQPTITRFHHTQKLFSHSHQSLFLVDPKLCSESFSYTNNSSHFHDSYSFLFTFN